MLSRESLDGPASSSDPYFRRDVCAYRGERLSQSCGRRVHEIGMRRALELLDATKDEDTRTFSPKDAAAAFAAYTQKELDEFIYEAFDYCFFGNRYWEKPEVMRLRLYRAFLKDAMAVWLKMAFAERSNDLRELRKQEMEQKEKERKERSSSGRCLPMQRPGTKTPMKKPPKRLRQVILKKSTLKAH